MLRSGVYFWATRFLQTDNGYTSARFSYNNFKSGSVNQLRMGILSYHKNIIFHIPLRPHNCALPRSHNSLNNGHYVYQSKLSQMLGNVGQCVTMSYLVRIVTKH